MSTKIETIPFLEIFKNAWKLAWKSRSLWWFGFLMLFSVPNFLQLYNYYSYINDGKNDFPQDWRENMLNFIHQNVAWLILAGVILSVLFIIFSVLNVISFGALVSSVEKRIKNQETTFMAGMGEGAKNFWKIIWIRLILFFILFIIVITLIIPIVILFVNKNIFLGVMLSLFAFFIFILAIILISNVNTFASLYAVLGKVDFWQSIKNGYDLFMKNILPCIIMGLLFIPIGLVLGIISLCAFLVILIIFSLISIIFYIFAGWYGVIIPIVFGVLLLIASSYLIKSIYLVFAQTAWIMFFHEIAKSKDEAMAPEVLKEVSPVERALPIIELEKDKK